MLFEKKYFEIKQLLNISPQNYELEHIVDKNFPSDEIKSKILDRVQNFINNFIMFKQIKPLMNSVYNCIKKTLAIEMDSIDDFDELLINNTLLYFVQEYINYSQFKQKDQILNFLTDSLQKLQVRPLIINLGLLLKPIYNDQEYIEKIINFEDTEIVYVPNNEVEINVKKSINKWLEIQILDLDEQEELKTRLKQEFDKIIEYHMILRDSETYHKLLNEINEMLTLKFTLLSLASSTLEESLDPIPIK